MRFDWFRLIVAIPALVFFVPQFSPAEQPAEKPASISIDRMRADLKYLASDQLQGRGVGSRGEELATDYIASQFQKAGLKPAGNNGTFFQAVPLVLVSTGGSSI
jgi:hypothetical protein